MWNNKECLEFKVKIVKERYASETFKVYVVDIVEGQGVKTNKYNEYVINGNVHTLAPKVEYYIRAIEENHKEYGAQYKIVNVRRDKPIDLKSSKAFLKEVITEKQTSILLSVYPNIIDKVIKNELDDVDLNKTKGIKQKTFENIKDKILENFVLIELIDRFGGAISFTNIKKLYDEYGSVRTVEQKLKSNPYECLCGLSRVGFKTADKILLNLQEKSLKDDSLIKFLFNLKTSEERMKACIDNVLLENQNNGHTTMKLKDLTSKCNSLTPECMKHFIRLIYEENGDYIVLKNKGLVVYRKTYETEEYIAKTLLEILHNSIDWNIETEVYRIDEGISLTDEQLNTLNNLVKYNVSILTAPAGAGKSQSVKMAVNMLDDLGKKYVMMTPTGKSSEVLAEYSGKDVGTIHRKLAYNPKSTPKWGYNEENKLDADVIIVDEFGMVDIFLMKHLLEAIDTRRTKILFVFDAYQLASVSCGNVAFDLLESGIIPVNRLTKIFRYGEGGLMNIATKTRNSEKFLPDNFEGVKTFGTKKDYIFVQRDDVKIPNQIVQIYKKLLEKYTIDDIAVLVAQNKGAYGTKAINKIIQELVQNEKDNAFIQRGDTKFYVGDKVMQITNNYKAINTKGEVTHIYNGNAGIVKYIKNGLLVVDFGEKKIIYSKEDLNQLELGYCVTIHKIQGSNAKQVIMITPKAHTFILNSNLLYVGETRAKERVYHIGDILTVNRAIKKKENLQRDTYLKEFLKQ